MATKRREIKVRVSGQSAPSWPLTIDWKLVFAKLRVVYRAGYIGTLGFGVGYDPLEGETQQGQYIEDVAKCADWPMWTPEREARMLQYEMDVLVPRFKAMVEGGAA